MSKKTRYAVAIGLLVVIAAGFMFFNSQSNITAGSTCDAKGLTKSNSGTEFICELSGEELVWIDEYGNAKYQLDVWKMILRFADFWNTYKPELVAAEYHVFSDVSKYAGTVDLVVRINKKLWLIDTKTSNSLHTAHNLQLAAYAMAWNETHTEPIEETGILWLKASTRGEGKGENIQGKGWQLKQIGDVLTNFRMFQNIYEIFKLENPNYRPMTESLPTTIKIAE